MAMMTQENAEIIELVVSLATGATIVGVIVGVTIAHIDFTWKFVLFN